MKAVGIICEYNPLHLGHKKQLTLLRQMLPDHGIVCLMSGNFVQRGSPAIIDRSRRAEAALACGADLVLELPITAALSSAEGFAAGGVSILGSFCDALCFGAEQADPQPLLDTAAALLSPAFPPALRTHLDHGLSFPAARAAALADLGLDQNLLSTPNNILAVEYCKAILDQGCSMKPLPIHREGSYHDQDPDDANPSATAVRRMILEDQSWGSYVPPEAHAIFENAPIHTLEAGHRSILSRLRTMTDEEFEALPFGSEGLWRKLMHASRQYASLEQIAAATKSKRYTRTRIDRMILCAFLGLTAADLAAPVPYARVLALNDRGREILKNARNHGLFPNIGEKLGHPYEQLENRADALYGLFTTDAPTAPITAPRIIFRP